MPRSRSVSACSATILCASSPIADRPSVKLPPEWAARPAMVKRRNTPPLRPETTLPLARPGSPFSTTRHSRATRSITGRENGDAISSSDVIRAASGPGWPPHALNAASRKALITSPAFMSATPGP